MQLNRFFGWFLVCVFLGVSACQSDNNKHALLQQEMPNVRVFNLMGDSVSLLPEMLNEPVLLNVWATWCTPCVKEMASLEEVAVEGDYKVVALATDGSKEQVRQFIEKNDLFATNFLFDAFGRKSRTALQSPSIPTTFLIDRNGIVQEVFLGEQNWQSASVTKSLRKYLEKGR